MLIESLFSQSSINTAPLSDFWYQPVGSVAKSGEVVTPESALKISAVFDAIRLTSQSIAGLRRRVRREVDDLRTETLTRHPLREIVRWQPNRWQTAFQFFEMMTGHALLRGRAIAQKVFTNGELTALVPLNPDKVQIIQLPDTTLQFRYHRDDLRAPVILPQDQVLHLPGFGLDSISGMSLVNQFKETAGLSIATESYGAHLFANMAQPRVVLKHPKTFAKKDTRARVLDSWQAAYGSPNKAGGTALLEDGLDIQTLGLNNVDAQFIESRKFLIEEFGRWMHTSPHMLGHLDRMTFNNVEQLSIEFRIFTLMPWVLRWEQTLRRDLLTQEEKASGMFIDLDVSELARGDMEAQAQFWNLMIHAGIRTRNEARQAMGENPLPGLDVPVVESNLATVNPDGSLTPASSANAQAQAQTQTQTQTLPSNADARTLALMHAAAEGLLTHERNVVSGWIGKPREDMQARARQFYSAHATHVRDKLCVPLTVANTYCNHQRAEVLASGPEIVSTWGNMQAMKLVAIALQEAA